MRKHLYVDNVDLATYGVYISGGGTFSAPEKEYTWYQVPNRNGDVLGPQNRLLNIEVSYDCFICANFDTNIADLRNFLLSRDGLVRIEDDYHTTGFRMGVYAGPFEPSVQRTLDAGSFTLTFICKPQRFLKSGETAISQSVTANYVYTISNPTKFPAKPIIRIYGYGTLYAGTQTPLLSIQNARKGIIISQLPNSLTYIDIDCESMNGYNGDTNLNAYLSVVDVPAGTSIQYGNYGADPPVLPSGAYYYGTQDNTITKIDITPRWWEV